jgi:calcineurin-like phosphoesterase family protein
MFFFLSLSLSLSLSHFLQMAWSEMDSSMEYTTHKVPHLIHPKSHVPNNISPQKKPNEVSSSFGCVSIVSQLTSFRSLL